MDTIQQRDQLKLLILNYVQTGNPELIGQMQKLGAPLHKPFWLSGPIKQTWFELLYKVWVVLYEYGESEKNEGLRQRVTPLLDGTMSTEGYWNYPELAMVAKYASFDWYITRKLQSEPEVLKISTALSPELIRFFQRNPSELHALLEKQEKYATHWRLLTNWLETVPHLQLITKLTKQIFTSLAAIASIDWRWEMSSIQHEAVRKQGLALIESGMQSAECRKALLTDIEQFEKAWPRRFIPKGENPEGYSGWQHLRSEMLVAKRLLKLEQEPRPAIAKANRLLHTLKRLQRFSKKETLIGTHLIKNEQAALDLMSVCAATDRIGEILRENVQWCAETTWDMPEMVTVRASVLQRVSEELKTLREQRDEAERQVRHQRALEDAKLREAYEQEQAQRRAENAKRRAEEDRLAIERERHQEEYRSWQEKISLRCRQIVMVFNGVFGLEIESDAVLAGEVTGGYASIHSARSGVSMSMQLVLTMSHHFGKERTWLEIEEGDSRTAWEATYASANHMVWHELAHLTAKADRRRVLSPEQPGFASLSQAQRCQAMEVAIDALGVVLGREVYLHPDERLPRILSETKRKRLMRDSFTVMVWRVLEDKAEKTALDEAALAFVTRLHAEAGVWQEMQSDQQLGLVVEELQTQWPAACDPEQEVHRIYREIFQRGLAESAGRLKFAKGIGDEEAEKEAQFAPTMH